MKLLYLYLKWYKMEHKEQLVQFVKEKRQLLNLTQPDLASKAGVGLRFLRDLEQGKASLRIDKVNQVLQLFGHKLGPVPLDRQK